MPNLCVSHASQNCHELFGLDARGLLGASAASLFVDKTLEAVVARMAHAPEDEPFPLPIVLRETGSVPLEAIVHVSGDRLIIEIEQSPLQRTGEAGTLTALRRVIGNLVEATSLQMLLRAVVRQVRQLTGYDRVLIFRFNAAWDGVVLAEDCDSTLEPYLGLHFPASDIPTQARDLYMRNRLRIIPDTRYTPIAVLPLRSDEDPLDMSRCLLRSVSPIHIEYLENMGVRGTLTISLISQGRLWGLIACHHHSPKELTLARRECCAIIGQIVSAQLALKGEVEDQAILLDRSEVLGRLSKRLAFPGSFLDNLVADDTALLRLTGAASAVLWSDGSSATIGPAPPVHLVPELIQWIKTKISDRIYTTNQLARDYGSVIDNKTASGLLSLQISLEPDVFLLWFRPEVIQTVDWAGDPTQGLEVPGDDGRLHPRRSFALWKETVEGQSEPWLPTEIEMARQLRSLILDANSRTLAKLEGLLPICAWCKKIRDEPGYWREVEEYVSAQSDVRFSHGICPDCFQREMSRPVTKTSTNPHEVTGPAAQPPE